MSVTRDKAETCSMAVPHMKTKCCESHDCPHSRSTNYKERTLGAQFQLRIKARTISTFPRKWDGFFIPQDVVDVRDRLAQCTVLVFNPLGEQHITHWQARLTDKLSPIKPSAILDCSTGFSPWSHPAFSAKDLWTWWPQHPSRPSEIHGQQTYLLPAQETSNWNHQMSSHIKLGNVPCPPITTALENFLLASRVLSMRLAAKLVMRGSSMGSSSADLLRCKSFNSLRASNCDLSTGIASIDSGLKNECYTKQAFPRVDKFLV